MGGQNTKSINRKMFINFPNYRCCTYPATLTTTTTATVQSSIAAAEEQLFWDKMWNGINIKIGIKKKQQEE